MKSLIKNSHQAKKNMFLILIVFGGFYLQNGFAQQQKSKIDYSVKSNILNPDTLRTDQKRIFYHPYFLKLTYKQADELEPLKIKAEFEKLGITTDQRARFVSAFNFFDTSMTNHKKSVENWESFKDLAPKN